MAVAKGFLSLDHLLLFNFDCCFLPIVQKFLNWSNYWLRWHSCVVKVSFLTIASYSLIHNLLYSPPHFCILSTAWHFPLFVVATVGDISANALHSIFFQSFYHFAFSQLTRELSVKSLDFTLGSVAIRSMQGV